jgi:hypothetical protein
MSKTRYKWLRAILIGLVCLIVLGVLCALWLQQDAFEEFVSTQVKAGIPLGTPRSKAEAWLQRTYGYGPQYRAPDEGPPAGLTRLAGVPEGVLGGVVETVATPKDLLGSAMNCVHPNHIFIYLLLDRNGSVQDYRFLSFNRLRKIEHAVAEPETGKTQIKR